MNFCTNLNFGTSDETNVSDKNVNDIWETEKTVEKTNFKQSEPLKRDSRFCAACGSPLSDGASFCSSCGAKTSSYSSENQSQRKTVFDGEIHKCPHCGEVLKSFETVCPACNFELRGTKSSSAVKELITKIEKLDSQKGDEGFFKTLKRKIDGTKLSSAEEQKISLISNFPIPNTKEDILEFMILSSSHILSKNSNQNASLHDNLLHKELKKAWTIKFEQAYNKAKICIKNASDCAEIEQCYKATIIAPKLKRLKTIKIALISALVSLVIIVAGVFIVKNLTYNPNIIKVGLSCDDIEGLYYEDAIELFEEKGFTNIKTREDGKGFLKKSGTVKSVTIDGEGDFSASSKFSKDAKIIILYYE